jgi:hypothetical protein
MWTQWLIFVGRLASILGPPPSDNQGGSTDNQDGDNNLPSAGDPLCTPIIARRLDVNHS